MKRIAVPSMIMIGAAKRDVGKTEFACSLISGLKERVSVVGIKVTTITECDDSCPRGGTGCGVCGSLKGRYEITEEIDQGSNKDTSRMKRAGATKVYWLKVLEESLFEGVSALLKMIDNGVALVCESNRAALVINPGRFIIFKDSKLDEIKESCQKVLEHADDLILFFSEKKEWSEGPENFIFEQGEWHKKFSANVIILAGGNSRRMGEDKSLLPLGNRTMIEHIVERVTPYFKRVLISSNSPEKYKHLNLEIVEDEKKDMGPLMGIYSSLKKSDSEINFVIACDSPEVELSFLKELFDKLEDRDAVVPIQDGRAEPLFALYKKTALTQFEKSLKEGDTKIKIALDQMDILFFTTEGILNLNNLTEYLEYKNRDISYN